MVGKIWIFEVYADMAASDWCHLITSTHSNYPDLTGYKLGLLSGNMTRWAYKSATHTRVKTRGALSAFEPLRSCELGSLSRCRWQKFPSSIRGIKEKKGGRERYVYAGPLSRISCLICLSGSPLLTTYGSWSVVGGFIIIGDCEIVWLPAGASPRR